MFIPSSEMSATGYAAILHSKQIPLKYLEQLTAAGVAWKSYTEQYFDSCGIFRDAIISIAATLAKQERLRISERTIAGLDRARKAGRLGGRPKLALDRDQARRMRAEGKSLSAIAAELGTSISTTARIVKEDHV